VDEFDKIPGQDIENCYELLSNGKCTVISAKVYETIESPFTMIAFANPKGTFFRSEPINEIPLPLGNRLEKMGFMMARILDVGCEEGRHCIYLAKRGFATYGIDIASLPIEKGRKWAEEKDLSGLVT
jgi:2-polyprenyl-3-methyl-5-hydroxy-6-metoxy-1,4-benzoquinol methylase